MAQGFGLRFSRTLHGNAPISMRCYVPASDGTILAKGDVVKLTGAMDDPNNIAPSIARAATGDKLLGVVAGFQVDGSLPLKSNYRAASTARYVDVLIDPDAVYQVQEDAVGGAVTAAHVAAMYNAALVVSDASAVTGEATSMLDSSTAVNTATDLKIVGVASDGGNNVAGATNGAILEVMILAPSIKATASA